MAFAIIDKTLWQPGASSGSSSAINTVGADLIIVSINAGDSVTGTISVSDSASNTWNPLTIRNIPFTGWARLFYAWNAITSSSHTFDANVTGGIFYPTATVAAYSGSDVGSDPFFFEDGGSTYGDFLGFFINANTVGDLLVGCCANLAGGNTPDLSGSSVTFTMEEGSPFVGGTAYAGWYADRLSANSTSGDSLVFGGLGSVGSSVSVASFKALSSGPTGNPWYLYSQLRRQ